MPRNTLKDQGIETYEPHNGISIRKENTLPFLNQIGHTLMHIGGFIAFIPSLIFTTLTGFFVAKRKIREVQMRHEPVLDLRKNQKRRLNLR